MKRAESKKSHSWWWDSHLSPKNSKWLAENLDKMDQSVKRMLKLIEEDGDSFAKKAQMYYQKRPELISQVEEFYRMYRSLAERYDHVTGELRKNIPSDLRSQGSGISDVGSEPTPTWSPSNQKRSRCKSGTWAAGFENFLGSGESSNKGDDESSTLDYESESDDSSVNNYSAIQGNGDDQELCQKMGELEVELYDVKQKLLMQKEENTDASLGGNKDENFENLVARIAEYEEERRRARENIRQSEEEIDRLKIELQKSRSHIFIKNVEAESELNLGANFEVEKKRAAELGERINELKAEGSESEFNVQMLGEELKVTKEKLEGSEREIANLGHEMENSRSFIQHLEDQLGLAQKDIALWKRKLDREKKEVSKLEDRISRYKANLSEREQEIRGLRETISNANQSLSEENTLLQAEISKLLKKQTYLEDNLKEWELRCQTLEEETRRVKAGKADMESSPRAEMEQLKDEFTLEYKALMAERDELNTKVSTFIAEVCSKDDRIEQVEQELKQLNAEHVELIVGTEARDRQVEELKSRVEQLEEEVQKKIEVILEGAEEKREAIRQLCFTLEYYRNGYDQLRRAFVGHNDFR